VSLADRKALDQCEQMLVFGQKSIGTRTRTSLTLNQRAKFDEILRSGNGHKEEARWREHPRALDRVTPGVKREDERHAVIEERQSPIGVGDGPGHDWKTTSGVLDRDRREIDADTCDRPRERQSRERISRSRAEVCHECAFAQVERGCAPHKCVDDAAPDASL
jgi:hypothetical protein